MLKEFETKASLAVTLRNIRIRMRARCPAIAKLRRMQETFQFLYLPKSANFKGSEVAGGWQTGKDRPRGLRDFRGRKERRSPRPRTHFPSRTAPRPRAQSARPAAAARRWAPGWGPRAAAGASVDWVGDASEAGRVLVRRARQTERVALCGLPLSIPPRIPRPYLRARGCRLQRVLGSSELPGGRAQRLPATAGSLAGPLLMACSARALQPRPRRRPPPRSLRGLPAGTQLTPQPRKPSSPPPPRPRTEPPPAPPRAQLGQRQPAPPSARPWGRYRQPSRLRGASPAVTQAALPGNFLPCRDHPAPRTRQRGLPPAAGGFLQDWETNPVSASRRGHSHP
ncbi:uncharacterized protein [Macaca fascicularis]|uniref:uncharacterized protein n=1 Tax=Macaca fascicularis TaxID=9541 RepID=UPI003D1536AF